MEKLSRKQNLQDINSSGVLSRTEILKRIKTTKSEERIFCTPMIDINRQLESSALDVRLGSEFIVFKRTKYPILDVCEEDNSEDFECKIGGYQEKVHVPFGERLCLHPQQLVLGCTLEYVKLPKDLMGELIGRSSWGRLGLIISAATLIHPRYAGVITLELANEGDTPLALYPGLRIAQLIFFKLLGSCEKSDIVKSKYLGSVEPSFSRLHEDQDLPIIRNFNRRKKRN